jgi:hypothetical protein
LILDLNGDFAIITGFTSSFPILPIIMRRTQDIEPSGSHLSVQRFVGKNTFIHIHEIGIHVVIEIPLRRDADDIVIGSIFAIVNGISDKKGE